MLRQIRSWVLICFVGLLWLGLLIGPLKAQVQPAQSENLPESLAKADIVIDGRLLFRLGSITGFTAQERADVANKELQQALETTHFNSPIRVVTTPQNELITIQVNNRHLLTVTQGDFMAGFSPQQQADDWAKLLQNALSQAQLERSPAYRQRMIWVSVFAGVLTVVAYGLIRVWRRYLWRHHSQGVGGLSYRQRLVQPALLCLQGLVWLALLIYLCELFPFARSWRYQVFQVVGATFSGAFLTQGGRSYSLLDLFKLLSVSVGLWLLVRAVTTAVKSRFLKAAIPDRGMQDAIATFLQVGLTSIGLFLVLQIWGIDLSALAIFASVLGVGLGFGLQNIVNNFVSGLIVLIERPIQVGDFINLDNLAGTVERVGARSTEIRTLDRVSIIIPNADIIQNKVINWSHGHPVSRLHIPLGVAYDSPIKQVHTAAIEAAQTHPEVLRYPQPRLRFMGFGDSALDFDLLVWIREPRYQFDIKSDLYYLLEANFRRYRIEIPFPQRDLHIRTPEFVPLMTPGATAQKPSPSVDQVSEVMTPLPAEPPIEPTPTLPDLLADVSAYSALLQRATSIAADKVEQLVADMRGPDGINISDRRFRLTVYPNCFVGSEAVTWLMQTQKATREAAVQIGQTLIERGVIHHVTDEHPFQDEYFFYRFYEDES